MFLRPACLIMFAWSVLLGISAVSARDGNISTAASHAIILDHETGTVLFDKNAYEAVPPASMSKLMTIAVTFEYLRQGKVSLDTDLYVSRKAWRTGGSKMFVLVDTHIPLRDLLTGAIVMSGNDACIVIAENLSSDFLGRVEDEAQLGSETAFAGIMNRLAREWGMSDSRFVNATGLPQEPGQLMSMYDLAQLTNRIIRDYPEYFTYFQQEEFTWSNITQRNRNPLLGAFLGADGMKTGHTEEAGFGIVGTAVRDGKRRIIVVGGLDSMDARSREANRIMGLAFSEYDSRTFYERGDIVSDVPVYMGEQETVPLTINSNVRFTTHRRSLDRAKASVIYEGPVAAPVVKGQQVAILRIELPGLAVQEFPLRAAADVRPVGFWSTVSAGLQSLLTPPGAAETP